MKVRKQFSYFKGVSSDSYKVLIYLRKLSNPSFTIIFPVVYYICKLIANFHFKTFFTKWSSCFTPLLEHIYDWFYFKATWLRSHGDPGGYLCRFFLVSRVTW